MEQLGINWKLMVAQVINFILLFIVFKKFVFKPFLDAIKKQKKQEKEALDKIETYEAKEKELYEKKLGLEKEYEERLKKTYNKVKRETAEIKKQTIKEAQREAEELRKQNLELIESEKKKMLQQVKQEAMHIALVLTEKALSEVTDEELQKEIVKNVTEKLPKVKHAD